MTIDPHHLRSLLAAATPGPWASGLDCVYEGTPGRAVHDPEAPDTRFVSASQADCDLIAAAVNALPELLDALSAKDAELSRRDKDIALLVEANDAKLSLLRQQERELNERDAAARESRERWEAEVERLREALEAIAEVIALVDATRSP